MEFASTSVPSRGGGIVPPIFFICSMKFNSTLFSVYFIKYNTNSNSITHAYTILFLFQFPAMLLIDF